VPEIRSKERMLQTQSEAEPSLDPPRDEQFRAIYRAEFEFVWAVARRFGVPPAALDDAVQEVFLAAFRRLDGLRYEVSPRAWLFTLARRVASRHHRTISRRSRGIAALASATGLANAAPHARHDAAMQLEQMLAQLSRGTRDAWELTELHGMSGPEIAAELGLPLNTVYSRLRLARAQLAALSADTVAAGVATARRRDQPPPDAARRNWALMVPLMPVGAGATATVVGGWVASHPALAATLLAVGVATVAGVATPRRGPPISASTRELPPAPAPRAATATPSAPIAVPDPPTAAPRQFTSTIGDDRLAAEVALINRAGDWLRAGDGDAALALIDRHAREFPAGTLSDAREAARVDALCLRGAAAEADAAAARLVGDWPGSLLARRYLHYVCTP